MKTRTSVVHKKSEKEDEEEEEEEDLITSMWRCLFQSANQQAYLSN
jgi:hypothetical protein